MTPLTMTIEQAAERLGSTFTVDWLKGHLHEIPHVKSGKGTGRAGRVGFTEAHLAEILLMFEQRPDETPTPDPDDWGVRTRRRSA